MNQTLERAIERLRTLSDDKQAEIASLLVTLAGETETPHVLTGAERDAVVPGLEEARQGRFVSDEDMTAFWNRPKA